MSASRKPSPLPPDSSDSLQRRVEELQSTLDETRKRLIDLEQREFRYRQVFHHSNDAVFVVDPASDKIIDVNDKACEILGYSRAELLSLSLSAIHPHEMDKLKAFAASVFKEKKGFTEELTCLTKGGDFLSAEMSASVVQMDGRTCMIAMVRDTSERKRLAMEREYLHGEIQEGRNPRSIIGESEALEKVLKQVEMVAPTEASVMIMGESGTGKELIAAAIHEQSRRRKRSIVTVNCASIPAELFESEFFGHAKGSFTGAIKDRLGRFELAHRSTLFLDEIGEIPLNLQGKLLRVLQEGQFERVGEDRTRSVDVRIIAATNRDLRTEVKEGRFREDLYYRLSVFPIEIPPLRDRREDIAPMAAHFVQLSCNRLGLPCPSPAPEELRALEGYSWPGNARELQNVIERAMILGRGRQLPVEALLRAETQGLAPPAGAGPSAAADGLTLSDLERMEREVIVAALEKSAWKIYGDHGAANRLDLKPTTLRSRMKKMGIEKP
ncbi:MAG: sigma 54-interacting transcriptional regulator [Planctomycetota bacterium]|nr:sigma 54-interacting transcriptional regulator [Planctomycetota bacterium]